MAANSTNSYQDIFWISLSVSNRRIGDDLKMLLLLSLTNLSIYVWISKAFEQSSKLSNPDLTKILFPLNQQIIPTKLKDNSHQKTLATKRLLPTKDKGLQLCDFSSRLAPLLSALKWKLSWTIWSRILLIFNSTFFILIYLKFWYICYIKHIWVFEFWAKIVSHTLNALFNDKFPINNLHLHLNSSGV